MGPCRHGRRLTLGQVRCPIRYLIRYPIQYQIRSLAPWPAIRFLVLVQCLGRCLTQLLPRDCSRLTRAGCDRGRSMFFLRALVPDSLRLPTLPSGLLRTTTSLILAPPSCKAFPRITIFTPSIYRRRRRSHRRQHHHHSISISSISNSNNHKHNHNNHNNHNHNNNHHNSSSSNNNSNLMTQ